MPRKKRWQESGVQDGVVEVKLFSWRYFFDYMYQRMLDYETYIWRGHRHEDLVLKSTLDRLLEKARVAKTKHSSFIGEHLKYFKYAARGRRGSNPSLINSENDWWALGQHHGLATPLLDWTTSPYVAAYFAFIETDERPTKYRAVFALHKPSIEQKALELMDAERKELSAKIEELEKNTKNYLMLGLIKSRLKDITPQVQFIRPFSDENQRLVNQSGLFTRAPLGDTIEDWVRRNFKGNEKSYVLMKILIPNKDRAECLKSLNRMNINHLTLFPDLYGASKFCNLYGEIEKY